MKKSTWLSLVTVATLLFLSISPSLTLAAQNSATFQINSGGDDVNQDGSSFTSTSSTLWLGNSSSTTAGFTGLRFNNIALPQGSTISSAQLQVYSANSQWISMSIQISADLSANSPAFSSNSQPGQRGLTTAKVSSSTNTNWSTATWYSLPDISSVIQEVVNQSGWQSGNSLSLIIKGIGGSYARKFISSFEGSAANSVKLVITYQTGLGPTSTSTAQASQTPTATSVAGATSTPGPTRTSTPTQPPTAQPTSSAADSPNITTFSLKNGGSDVIPHQLIRTADDRLYFFGYYGNASNLLEVYWTTSPGLPGSSANYSGSTSLAYPANIISVSPAYDGANTVHIITNSTDGDLKDVPFNTSTNTFKTPKVLATGLTTANTDGGTSGVSAAFDLNGNLAVAYWSGSNHIIYVGYQYNQSADKITTVAGPSQVDTAGGANHPNLAVSPSNNTITIAWVSQAVSPATILTRTYSASGWGSIQTASSAPVWTSPDSGLNIDQGPSLIIDTNGVKYLSYIEDYRTASPYDYGRTHYVVDQGSGWVDTYTGFYTHDPSLAMDNKGHIYIVGHGYPINASPCNTVNNMCVYVKNSPGSWTPNLIAAPTGSNSFDASPSTKWSAVGYNRADTVEFVFPEIINGSYANSVMHYARINSSGQSSTSTPVPTASNTPVLQPTSTPVIGNTPTSIPTTSSSSQLTLQVNQSLDDVNQDGTTLTTDWSTVWIGNGASTSSSYAGFRFKNIAIPRGATIKSAQIQLYSALSQWINFTITIAGDKSANSSPWSAANLPSQRSLTTANVTSATDENWSIYTWYLLPDISPVIQEIVNQSSWQSGNSLSIIITGVDDAYARKFAASFEGDPAYAPRLIITFQ